MFCWSSTSPPRWARIAGMRAEGTYGVQRVARATGIPVRRLEGWIERGVVVPTVAARGTGTRARFSREDALRVAIVAEIQHLFGSNLRPGSVASKVAHDPLNFAHVDAALRLGIREDAGEASKSGPGGDAREKLRLYVHHGSHGLSVGATRKPPEELLKA